MQRIQTDKAPAAVGPYSQAINDGSYVFCSGQIGLDPETGKLVEGSAEDEFHQAMTNLLNVLEAAGSGLKWVTQVTLYLTDMKQFANINKVYAEFFDDHKPARVTVGVNELPLGAQVEVSCTART